MTLKIRAAFKNLIFMQKKITDRNAHREAKLDILENSWNKFLGLLLIKNNQVGDTKTQKMIRGIGAVKPVIKREALSEYLRCS